MKNIDELARGSGVSSNRLNRQLKNVNERRKEHRFSKNGWSYDKDKSWLAIARIPTWVYLHPDFKDTYFADDQDQHERTKNMELFLQKYPQFRAR